MASGKSAYLEGKLLDLVFSGTLWTPPATLYFGLSTALFNSGAGPTEPVGNNYSRPSSTNDATMWPAASGTPTTKANAIEILFPVPSATWGTVRSIYVLDALTGGNWLYGGDLTTVSTIISGTAPSFDVGDLLFREM